MDGGVVVVVVVRIEYGMVVIVVVFFKLIFAKNGMHIQTYIRTYIPPKKNAPLNDKVSEEFQDGGLDKHVMLRVGH